MHDYIKACSGDDQHERRNLRSVAIQDTLTLRFMRARLYKQWSACRNHCLQQEDKYEHPKNYIIGLDTKPNTSLPTLLIKRGDAHAKP